jgi:hypothetical protein
MSMQVQYMGSSDPDCAVMVQNELLESVRMIAYGVVWNGMERLDGGTGVQWAAAEAWWWSGRVGRA